MLRTALEDLNHAWEGVDPNDTAAVLNHALDLYHPRMALASSFGKEDVVLIDMLVSLRADVRIFSLDTGRLNPETYECAEAIRRRYKARIEWFFPKREVVEELENDKGLFSFRESVENRKECCTIRKVEPLARALKDLDAWMTGQRREQSVTRSSLRTIEIDESHGGIAKINPLSNWTHEDVGDYVQRHGIPYNALHDQGYPSIGCAPCTRAVQAGEDQRAGRWWWERADHKECGLHANYQMGDGI